MGQDLVRGRSWGEAMDVQARPLRFEAQTLVLLGGRAMAYALTMAIPLVLVRTMTPETFGTYKQLFLLFTTLWTVLQFGLAESLYYFFPKDPQAKGAYVVHTIVVLGAAGGAACVGLWAGRGLLAAALHNPALEPYLPLLGLYLWLMLPTYLLETILIIERRAVQAALTFAGSEAIKVAAVVAPAVLGAGIRGILWGSLLHAILRVVATGWYLSRFGWPACPLSWGAVRRHWAYAAPLGISAVICLLQVSADQYSVSMVYGAAAFAIYAVGLFQIPIVELVATVTASTFMVELARLRPGDANAAIDLWYQVTVRLAVVCFPVCGFAVYWAPDVISVLFTDTYHASVPIFRVVACGALVAPLLTDAVLRVYSDTPWILRVNLVKLLLTSALVPAAVAWTSLTGVAAVGVLMIVLGKGLMLRRIADRMGLRMARVLPWSAVGVIGLEAVACLIPAAWLSQLWATAPAGRLGIGLIAYAALYSAVVAVDRAVRTGAIRPAGWPPMPTERETP